jgi:hypothetical protein
MAERETIERLRGHLAALGAGVPRADLSARQLEAVEELWAAGDEDLVTLLAMTHTPSAAGTQGVMATRDSLRALIDLRTSERAEEQARALTDAVSAFREAMAHAAEASRDQRVKIEAASNAANKLEAALNRVTGLRVAGIAFGGSVVAAILSSVLTYALMKG